MRLTMPQSAEERFEADSLLKLGWAGRHFADMMIRKPQRQLASLCKFRGGGIGLIVTWVDR